MIVLVGLVGIFALLVAFTTTLNALRFWLGPYGKNETSLRIELAILAWVVVGLVIIAAVLVA